MIDTPNEEYAAPTLRPVWGDPARQLLRERRDRAERQLNGVRAVVLLLLGVASLLYAPELTPALNRVNVLVLVPTLSWTLLQYLLFYREKTLPNWLPLANPLVDITAVTVIIGGYALAQSATLALKTPIFLVYFVILAARPIASSATKTAFVAGLVVLEYAGLLALLIGVGELSLIRSPVAASGAPAISILDEGTKLLLLAVAGAIATYATELRGRVAAGRLSRPRDADHPRCDPGRRDSSRVSRPAPAGRHDQPVVGSSRPFLGQPPAFRCAGHRPAEASVRSARHDHRRHDRHCAAYPGTPRPLTGFGRDTLSLRPT